MSLLLYVLFNRFILMFFPCISRLNEQIGASINFTLHNGSVFNLKKHLQTNIEVVLILFY